MYVRQLKLAAKLHQPKPHLVWNLVPIKSIFAGWNTWLTLKCATFSCFPEGSLFDHGHFLYKGLLLPILDLAIHETHEWLSEYLDLLPHEVNEYHSKGQTIVQEMDALNMPAIGPALFTDAEAKLLRMVASTFDNAEGLSIRSSHAIQFGLDASTLVVNGKPVPASMISESGEGKRFVKLENAVIKHLGCQLRALIEDVAVTFEEILALELPVSVASIRAVRPEFAKGVRIPKPEYSVANDAHAGLGYMAEDWNVNAKFTTVDWPELLLRLRDNLRSFATDSTLPSFRQRFRAFFDLPDLGLPLAEPVYNRSLLYRKNQWLVRLGWEDLR